MFHHQALEDFEHAREESLRAEARVRHLRELPPKELSDQDRNALLLADYWDRKARTPALILPA